MHYFYNKSQKGGYMINIIWAVMMTTSVFYMIMTGNSEKILESITLSSSNAIQLCISLIGIYCFWLGIMNIASSAKINDKIAKLCSPVLNKLFPNTSEYTLSFISMNIASNMLGLGNAATPYGLKAMQELHKENQSQNTPSEKMILFAVINSASLQIIPTTVISLRHTYGASNPSSIVLTTLLTTLISAVSGVLFCKILGMNRAK